MSTEKSHVALTNCFFCGQPDRILLCTRYRRDGQPVSDMSEFHGKVIDHEPCKKCADYMKQGVIVITVKDDDKDYRTGGWFVLRDAAIERLIQPGAQRDEVLKKRCVFMPHSVAESTGLLAHAKKTEPAKEGGAK